MKRILAVLLLCALLTACKSQSVEVTSPSPAPTATPTAELTAAPTPTPTPTVEPTATPTPTPVVVGNISVPYGTESLDLGNSPYTIEEVAEVKRQCPNISILWTFEFYGRTLCTADEGEIDLSYIEVSDLSELQNALSLFENAASVNLSFCSLSNEELASLREQTDNIKVVWTVVLRYNRWSVRTDMVAFSTKQYDPPDFPLTSEHVDPLRYCTELVALDLGHNHISDLSFLEGLTNLKVLILADNRISDISSIAKLEKLMYLEIFKNSITDLSPIENMDTLVDVNFGFNPIENIEPLFSCDNLERIWMRTNTLLVSQEDQDRLIAAFPNATIDFRDKGATAGGWRDHPRYTAYIKMFDENIVVSPFD
ncbi:MAG: leucine-rich repeat domain-containing protein [Clostridia bacterium]|nr:leucine-rich repeat domain-containing protein [Clostridia bacterium]